MAALFGPTAVHLAMLALVVLPISSGVAVSASASSAVAPCTGPDADPWAAAFRGRTLSFNSLAQFAVAEFGGPVDCDGAVTTEFDGARYGTLLLTFQGGVALEVETLPIETSIVTLRSSAGFEHRGRVEDALRSYAAQIGVSIDWTQPEQSMDDDESTATYWDPDPGLNASASLVSADGRLVAVRLSMAL